MRLLALLLALLAATPAAAQALVESQQIDSVAVTLYRDPQRGQRPIRASGWPGGYALVTETRTISVPAGPAVVRFIGVSEGMMPETAIITGLPRGVDEKNRDARLLSPASLVDAYLKRRVTIRRTSRATGKVTEGEAIIQAGPGGGVVLTTSEGVEALGCSGLPEALTYDGVPADLSAKPTLSVTTNSATAATVTVQLSYLAQGLDWSANYVATVAEDGASLELFAWLTVVNGGSQGFANARTSAVAGQPNKEAAARLPQGPDPQLRLQCWPMDNTSTHPRWGLDIPPPPPPPPPAPEMAMGEDIVVTGFRASLQSAVNRKRAVMVAAQEELGDLKLYRVPEPVTVAAQSRKQVAMIQKDAVKFERVYVGTFADSDYARDSRGSQSGAALRVLRMRNRRGDGLGLPLPAGGVAVFEQVRGQSLLVGESQLADRAIGEEVEFATGEATDVRYAIVAQPTAATRRAYAVEVSNARATPAIFELPIPYKVATKAKLVERKGVKTWRVIVPANGTAKLDFAIKLER